MIDPRIRNAAIALLALLILGPIAVRVWSSWMADTQGDMIDNQVKLQDHVAGVPRDRNESDALAAAERVCEKRFASPACSEPETVSDVNKCLRTLSSSRCGSLPNVNLCAVVVQIEMCADPFADQNKNGCAMLRRTANCQTQPAPQELTGYWRIAFDSD